MPNKILINDVFFSKETLIELMHSVLPYSGDGLLVAASAADPLAFYASLCFCESRNLGFLAFPSYWNEDQMSAELKRRKAVGMVKSKSKKDLVFIESKTEMSIDHAPGVIFYTSGTTGEAKAIQYDWQTISAPAIFAAKKLSGFTWYQIYERSGYAGFQIYFSSMASLGDLIVPDSKFSYHEHARYIHQHKVDIISATPSWWRMLISGWPKDLPVPVLCQATLGGELVDQPILDLIDLFFKPERLTHIYASSEVGSAVVVSDRKAGFPVELFIQQSDIRLRLNNDVLEVNSPYRMKSKLGKEVSIENWINTGDLVIQKNNRYFFAGRKDQQLNIGGAKVAPEEVENELLKYPDVYDCYVHGKKNPILGMILVADLVLKESGVLNVASLKSFLADRLAQHKIPQHFKQVSEIGVSANGKKLRN